MPTFSRHHLRVSSTPQHILHTNTIQNTSLPTKCLHRADLQHNDFLVPIIEALKDVYESQPDVLRCYVRCRGTGSRVEKMEKPFPQSVMCSIPSNPGPEGGAHMGWGKGKLLFTLEMEVCWWDKIMEDVGLVNCTVFISREDNFHIKCPNLNSSSLCIYKVPNVSRGVPWGRQCMGRAMHFLLRGTVAFKQTELTSRWIHQCQIFWHRFEMTLLHWRVALNRKTAHPKADVGIHTSGNAGTKTQQEEKQTSGYLHCHCP